MAGGGRVTAVVVGGGWASTGNMMSRGAVAFPSSGTAALRRKRCTPTPNGDLYIGKKTLSQPHGRPLHRMPRLSQLRLHVKPSWSPHVYCCPAGMKAPFNFPNLDSAWSPGGRLKHCKILIVCKNKHSVPLI